MPATPASTSWTPNSGSSSRPLTVGMEIRLGPEDAPWTVTKRSPNGNITIQRGASITQISGMADVEWRWSEAAIKTLREKSTLDERGSGGVGSAARVGHVESTTMNDEREDEMAIKQKVKAPVPTTVARKVAAAPVAAAVSKATKAVRAKTKAAKKALAPTPDKFAARQAEQEAEAAAYRARMAAAAEEDAAAESEGEESEEVEVEAEVEGEEVESGEAAVPTSDHVLTVQEVADMAEVKVSRVNGLRREGHISTDNYVKQGRVILYTAGAVEDVVTAQAEGVKIPAPGTKAKAAGTVGVSRTASSTDTPAPRRRGWPPGSGKKAAAASATPVSKPAASPRATRTQSRPSVSEVGSGLAFTLDAAITEAKTEIERLTAIHDDLVRHRNSLLGFALAG